MSDLNIKEIRENLGLSQTDFARKIGVSLRTVQNYESGGVVPASKYEILRDVGKIESNSPEINYDNKGVPYYDVDFIGGFEEVLNDQTINPEYFIDFKPYNTAKYWANVSGHSMEPNISHGDIIAIKEIENWIDFLPFGEIYGIVTDEFRTIKVVSKGDSSDTFNLIPLNKDPQYVQQEIPKRLIRKVFSVLGAVKKF